MYFRGFVRLFILILLRRVEFLDNWTLTIHRSTVMFNEFEGTVL